MIHETGNEVLDALERRIGGLSLPQILRWIAIFQAFSWGLSLFSPGLLNWIYFDREAILSGQVWRLFSWVLFPVATGMGGLIFVLFALLIMFFINDSLEREWGSFRLNVYVVSSIVLLALVGLLPFVGSAVTMMNGAFYSCAFLAFAAMFPEQELRLMGIIPVKAKWLGWANGALLGAAILTASNPPMGVVALVVLAGLLPWFLVFIPSFFTAAKQRGESAVRRHRFEQATAIPEGDAFHTCESCGATDQSDPDLEFRVARDGHEYCENCRSPAAAKSD